MNQQTSPTPNAAELASQANAWVVRLASGQATVQDARELRAWVAQSEQHASAYHDATRLWKQTGQLQLPRHRSRRLAWLAGAAGIAASCVLTLFGAMQLGLLPDGRALLADHHTALAERRQIELPDGSRVELDARTHLNVDFSDNRRHIRLQGGAAVFHVQHDAARPFVVSADGGSVTALGTVFEVRHQGTGVQVTCSEGSVAVERSGAEQTRLIAGQQLRYDERNISQPSQVDTTQVLAWRQGSLVFKNRPLQELVDELNRYRPGRVIIADASIAQMPVSGVFHLQQPEQVLAHIEQTLALRSTHLPAGLTVLR